MLTNSQITRQEILSFFATIQRAGQFWKKTRRTGRPLRKNPMSCQAYRRFWFRLWRKSIAFSTYWRWPTRVGWARRWGRNRRQKSDFARRRILQVALKEYGYMWLLRKQRHCTWSTPSGARKPWTKWTSCPNTMGQRSITTGFLIFPIEGIAKLASSFKVCHSPDCWGCCKTKKLEGFLGTF